MKSFLIAICLVASGMLLISCGDKSGETENEATETATTEHPADTQHTHATSEDGLVLNDGKKWQMDDHTRGAFATMASSLKGVDVTGLDTAALKKVGDKLMEDLNALIQGCTMTGPDHDQLHVYLMAYIPAVTALQESGLVADAKKVQHYLTIYGDYFE